MRSREIFIIVFLSLIALADSTRACTAFVLKDDSTIVLAKNLDWFMGDGFIIINKRGITKTAFSIEDSPALRWKSLYGSVTFNQLGKGFPLGGMNEKGLVIEELNYSLSRYPRTSDRCLNEMQWIQYHLDNFQSVQEVLENLQEITISPLLFKLHYFLCDRSGEVAIVEFIKGKIKSYSGEEIVVPVLANNSYENSLKYLRHHFGFGGDRIVSDGPESPERFVRAATGIGEYEAEPDRYVVNGAFKILDSVRQDDTRWSIVYDISGGEISFKTMNMPRIRLVGLNSCSFEDKEMIYYLAENDSTNSESRFERYSPEKDIQLLKGVLEKLNKAGEISETLAEEILKRHPSITGAER
ncbi:MAG: linear amide C-N hydrolase [Candidatus Krumholzibacteriota bacterium]|nr:linear amide C-N hydrolase [Candidatus Krumholzibacteriota bacterium]